MEIVLEIKTKQETENPKNILRISNAQLQIDETNNIPGFQKRWQKQT